MKFSDLNKKKNILPPVPEEKATPSEPAPTLEPPKSGSLIFSNLPAPERPPTPPPQPEETAKKEAPPPAPKRMESMFSSLNTKGRQAQDSPAAPSSAESKPASSTKQNMPLTHQTLQTQRKEAAKIYGQSIQAIQAIFSSIENYQLQISPLLGQICSDILRLLCAENQSLVALTTRSTANNYLYAHAVNMTILALHIARNFQWDDEQLHILGVTSLLHDIGMVKYLGMVQEPRSLNEAEVQEIRMHPMESARLLEHIKDIEESTKKTVAQISSQVHERRGGKGYPKGLKRDEDIHLAAQVIGLCDTYEAMTHYRNWREPMIPHQAVKQIIRQCSHEFNPKLMKIFTEQLSIFPLGSYVQLSSGEIGCVVRIHPHLPTRPVVEVKVQANGEKQETLILIDLSDNPMIHASQAVDETKLTPKDKKLLLQLQAGRWWTE